MNTAKPTSTKARHIPRRSGVGARQAVQPSKPKGKSYRPKATAPTVCGVEHPNIVGLVCTASIRFVNGQPVKHRGAHRATPLRGIRFRWAVVEDGAK